MPLMGLLLLSGPLSSASLCLYPGILEQLHGMSKQMMLMMMMLMMLRLSSAQLLTG